MPGNHAVLIIILIGVFAITPILFDIIRKIHFLLDVIVETWHPSLPWNSNIRATQQGRGGKRFWAHADPLSLLAVGDAV